MIAPAVLICGARALAGSPDAAQWAVELIAATARIAGVVVTGDASGPDAWAAEYARDHARRLRVYRRDGTIGTERDTVLDTWTRAPAPDAGAGRHAWRQRLLARDRAMVEACALVARAQPNRIVRVLALRAPWAATHGTGYTADHARKRGLWVTEEWCPAAMGPGARA